MYSSTALAVTTLSLFIPLCSTWGTLGRRTIAYIADTYLDYEGAWFIHGLLNGSDISDASLWADQILDTLNGYGTEPWHYIAAKDDPPSKCRVVYERDCDAGNLCVVDAIKEMTSLLLDPSLPHDDHVQDLKFIIHSFGDIHAPLHTTSTRRSGHAIPVLFDGHPTTLHAVWDSAIARKHNNLTTTAAAAGATCVDDIDVEEEKALARKWSRILFDKNERAIISGIMDQLNGKVPPQSAIGCMDLTRARECALEWANDANHWVCEYVLAGGVERLEGKELGGEYFEGAVAVVEEMLIKAGYRLGRWLNEIARMTASEQWSETHPQQAVVSEEGDWEGIEELR